MDYYLGGYLLLHCLPIKHSQPQLNGKPLLTCSTCFNESLLDDWSYCWLGFDKNALYDATSTISEHLAAAFSLNSERWEQICVWANENYEREKIGWPDLFMDADTAIEYKQTFFPDLSHCYLLALYFSEKDTLRFIDSWQPRGVMEGAPGIHQKLSVMQPEEHNENERLLGYDIVGLDGGFHTSHCHGLHDILHQRFGLTLNEHGLYNSILDWQPVVDYMNDEKTACEPVPWGIAKIKQVIF